MNTRANINTEPDGIGWVAWAEGWPSDLASYGETEEEAVSLLLSEIDAANDAAECAFLDEADRRLRMRDE